jgi:hypothetical protein
MLLATAVLHGHGQDRAHITGNGGFGDAKGTSQVGLDAITETLKPEVLGNLLSAQAGVKTADTVISAPTIRALTDLCPTGICTPNVWHLSYRFCASAILRRDTSPT